MENPCLRCHMSAAALNDSGAIIGFGAFASRVRRQEKMEMVPARLRYSDYRRRFSV